MKAAVLYKPRGALSVEEVDFSPPRRGEVVVRVRASGVCGTDLHAVERASLEELPIVGGHEGAGVAEKVGEDVTLVQPGDHVVLSWANNCGRCYFCTIGRPNLCEAEYDVEGIRLDGSARLLKGDTKLHQFFGLSTFAEYTVVPQERVIPVPKDVPFTSACLLGCGVTTGVGAALNTARVQPGSTVAVWGCGGVGLSVIQGAAIAGAERIIGVDLLDRKLGWARSFGATHVVNAATESVEDRIRELTGGAGVDYAFEAIASNSEPILQVLGVVRKGGKAIIIGTSGREVSVPLMRFISDERSVTTSLYGSARPRVDFLRLIGLYKAKRLKLDELVTKTYPLEKIDEAFKDARDGFLARGVLTMG